MVDTTNTTSQPALTKPTIIDYLGHDASSKTVDHDVQAAKFKACQSLACSSCEVLFDSVYAQREHVKDSWHVYNIKRRIAYLPPISRDVFSSQVIFINEHLEDSCAREATATAARSQCLFCKHTFNKDDEGLEDRIDHMSVSHGFIIPDFELLWDLESFLGYLTTAVREWHECLYCGTMKAGSLAIQSHMRDKGHCKLNLDREPELLEFWEEKRHQVSGVPIKTSSRSPASFSAQPGGSRASEHEQTATPVTRESTTTVRAEPRDSHRVAKNRCCGVLSRRDEMGIDNIGPQQRRALVMAVKRSQQEERRIASRATWSYAEKANKQKHDQAHGVLSWAKGGMHNLLPR